VLAAYGAVDDLPVFNFSPYRDQQLALAQTRCSNVQAVNIAIITLLKLFT
jgi:hypothetical protein